MFYRKYQPAEILLPFVECYFVWDSEGPLKETLVVESPPNGFCSIVFNYADPYRFTNNKYQDLQVPLQFISGQNIFSYQLHLSGAIGIAGIVFKPAALATILDLAMFDFVEERIDLFKVFPKDIVAAYINNIRSAEGENEKAKMLEQFVLQQIHTNKPQTDYIDEAANLIVEKNGMLQVAELLKNSCMSRRTFERKFFQKVGLSPKYYARIRRISYLLNLIAGKKKVDWPQLFYECEFYDQAHFIKDFEAFTGRTPQQYLKENTELVNFVEKPVIRPIT